MPLLGSPVSCLFVVGVETNLWSEFEECTDSLGESFDRVLQVKLGCVVRSILPQSASTGINSTSEGASHVNPLAHLTAN